MATGGGPQASPPARVAVTGYGRWRQDLVTIGVIASAGVAAVDLLINGAPTIASVLATGGAATGMLILAARPLDRDLGKLNAHRKTTPTPHLTAPRDRASLSRPIPLRTSMWPAGRSLRLRADHADVTRMSPGVLNAGDPMWDAWESSAGELPGHLVGPVPETFVPLTPSLSSAVFDTGAPEFVLPSLAVGPAACGPVTSSLAPPPLESEDVAFTDIELEALTPLPPHLRTIEASPTLIPPPQDDLPGGIPVPVRTRCSTCRRSISGAPDWRRCPECRGPLCGPCSVNALKTQARAWCAVCAPLYDA